MEQYYYSDGTNSFGPFSVDELRGKGITPQTMVWSQSLGEWKPASQVSELSSIFYGAVPPTMSNPNNNYQNNQNQYNNYANNQNRPTPPKTWLVESILATLFCCLPFGIVGIVNASKVESSYNSGNYDASVSASAAAKKWTMLSFWLGLAAIVIYVIFYVILGASMVGLYGM